MMSSIDLLHVSALRTLIRYPSRTEEPAMNLVLTDNLERELEQRYFARRFLDRDRQLVPVGRWVRRIAHRGPARPLD